MGRIKGKGIKLYKLYDWNMELVMIGTSFQIAEYMGKGSWWVHSKLRQQKRGGDGYCSNYWVEHHERKYIIYDSNVNRIFEGTKQECMKKLGIKKEAFDIHLKTQNPRNFKYWIEEVDYDQGR